MVQCRLGDDSLDENVVQQAVNAVAALPFLLWDVNVAYAWVGMGGRFGCENLCMTKSRPRQMSITNNVFSVYISAAVAQCSVTRCFHSRLSIGDGRYKL